MSILLVCCSCKLRTDAKVRDVYKIGKTLGTGGELVILHTWQCFHHQIDIAMCRVKMGAKPAAGFAVVKLATERATGGEYAVKIMSLPERGRSVGDNENSRDDIFKEIDILVGLNHPNVIYLREYFEENNRVRICTPCPNCIASLLTGFPALPGVRSLCVMP